MPLLVACVATDPVSVTPVPVTATISAVGPPSEASEPLSPTPFPTETPPTPSTPGRVTLNSVGDIMLARDLITLMDQNGSIYPYQAVARLLADADITIGNMEGTFTDAGVQADKFYTFRTPPAHAAGLAQAGFDVVSLGNNHAMDYGEEGLQDTLAALDGAGIAYSGAGMNAASARQPAILEANGLTIAFLSYNAAALSEASPAGPDTPGVALAEAPAIQTDVIGALASADVVIVSLHAGTEYTQTPTTEQMTLGRAAIDAGAAVVLGHHPHVLQGWEQYGGGYIFYSLGNFVFDLDFDDLETLGPAPFQTMVLQLELTSSGVESVNVTPVFIDPAENRPTLPEGERLQTVEALLERLGSGHR